MKVVNLFAEPGAGKSTTAAGLFFLMKCAGYNVELATEYAKDLVWEERKWTFNDQLYITAKQNHKLERLRGKVSYVITDSPILLGLVYKRDSDFPSFDNLLYEVFDSYDNFNVLIKRVKPYKQLGRNQNEHQAKEVAKKVRGVLVNNNIRFVEIDGDASAPQKILDKLTKSS